MKCKHVFQLIAASAIFITSIMPGLAQAQDRAPTYQSFLPTILTGAVDRQATVQSVTVALSTQPWEENPQQAIDQELSQYPIQVGEDTLIVSQDLFELIRAWQGDAMENGSFEEFLVDQAPEIIDEWSVLAERNSAITLTKYMLQTYPSLPTDRDELESGDPVRAVRSLLLEYPEYFYTWQVTQLQEADRLLPFVKNHKPELYDAWAKSRYIPATEMCLLDYVGKMDAGLLSEATRYYVIRTGSSNCPEHWPPPTPDDDDCNCMHIFTFLADPSNPQSETDPTVEEDNADKKDQWWTEQWKAAHYGELYAHIKKKSMTSFDVADLHNTNSAAIGYELSCTDRYYKDCAQCFAKFEQYAHYGAKLQTNIEGSGTLFHRKELKVAVGDSAKMITTLENGQVVGFEKAGAVTMHSKKTFDGEKVVSILKNIISIAFEVAKIDKDNEGKQDNPDWQKTLTLAADTTKNFFALVKYEGMEGTKSHELKVTFNSSAVATDPTYTIESNQDYALRIESAGSITFEAKGKFAKTNNSYYGSGFAAAIGVHSISCVDPVNRIPKPAGAWSYANAYHSPYSNTTTFQSNVANFIQQATNSTTAPNTSNHQGWWEAP